MGVGFVITNDLSYCHHLLGGCLARNKVKCAFYETEIKQRRYCNFKIERCKLNKVKRASKIKALFIETISYLIDHEIQFWVDNCRFQTNRIS